MKSKINWQDRVSQALFIFIILFILGALVGLIFLLKDLVIVFVFALLINYLFAKPVDYLCRLIKLRSAAVLIVLIFVFTLLGFIISRAYPVIYDQVSSFKNTLPLIEEKLKMFISGINLGLPDNFQEILSGNFDYRNVVKFLSSSLAGSIYIITACVITLIVSFYLLVDGNKVWQIFTKVFPASYGLHLSEIKKRIDSNLNSLVIGQFKIAAITSLVMLFTYLGIGSKFALLLGTLQMLEFIPVFGTWAAIVPSIIIVTATSGANKAIVASVVYLIYTQIIRDHIIAPRIMGSAFGIHPLAVIFGLLIGMKAFGAIGVIVSLPIIAIVSAIIDYLLSTRDA